MMPSIRCTPVTLPIEYRSILLRTTAHEIRKQFAGSALGAIWIVLGPFILVVLYSAIYLVVFRIQPVGMTLSQYVLYVISGLLSFITFAGGLVAGANCLRTGRELLLNRVFPSELLPLRAALISSTPLIIGLTLVSGAAVYILGATWWLLLLPLAISSQLMFTAGVASLLALMMIVSRDTQHILQYLILMLLIITPIAYTQDMVPASIAPILYANPLYYFVSMYQHAIVYQAAPPAHVLIGALVLGMGMYTLGFVAFRRGKRVIDDFV